MSWKSFVSAGLLCVLASPVFAAPTLRVVNGPALAPNGNWQWTVSVETSFADTPVAVELGFDANRAVVGSPAKGSLFDGSNTENPGADIFNTAVDGDWEVYSDTDLTGGVNMQPVGLQVGGTNLEQIFAALGSEANLPNSPAQSTFLTIVTAGPTSSVGGNTGTLQVLGAYGTGGNEGRIAELTGALTSANYKGYVGTASRTLQPADINLSGTTDAADASVFSFNWQTSTSGGWSAGDFDRSGFVDAADASYFSFNWQGTGGASTNNLSVTGMADPPGSGAGGGVSAVPEPASLALIGLGLLGGMGLIRRKR